MIHLTEKNIRAFLGPKIWARAEEYYRYRYVLDTRADGPWIVALVQGSGRNKYVTRLNKETTETTCSCPYGDGCKHIGALMLKCLYEGYPVEIIETAEMPAEPENTEKILPISFAQSHSLFSSVIPVMDNRKSSAQRYRLIFTITVESAWNSSTPVFSPKLQYIKKDGSYGRIEEYSPQKLTEKVSASNRELMMYASGYDDSIIPLPNIAHIAAQYPDADILDCTDKITLPAAFENFDALEISFRFTGMWNNRMLKFLPEFKCSASGGAIKDTLRLAVNDAGIVCQGRDGIFYFNNSNPAMTHLVTKILSYRGEYYDGDIRELSTLVSADTRFGIKVVFPHQQLIIKKGGGKPILEIASQYGTLGLELFFNYEGLEIAYTQPEQFFETPGFEKKLKGLYVAERDQKYEDAVMRYISGLIGAKTRMTGAEDGEHFSITITLEKFLSDYGRTFIDAGINLRMKKNRHKINAAAGKVAFKVSNSIDWFDAQAVYIDESGNESPLEIDFDMMKSGLVKAGDEYVFIAKDDVERFAALEKSGMTEKGKVKIHPLDFSTLSSFEGETEGNAADDIAEILKTYDKLKNVKEIATAVMPKKFKGELRPYQTEGYNWLQFLREYNLNGCLADDMGLGKTVQTLALLQKLKEEKKLSPALLIVPVSTIPNWEQEIARFAPTITFLRHIGQFRNSDEKEILAHDITITSYHTLRNDISLFQKIKFSYLILDEAQNIKNAATKAFKAVKTIHSQHILALSGTPVENNTGELWALFDILNPGLLGSKDHFSAHYAKPIEQYGDKDAAARLRALVFPFILRRKKEMVAKELPPKEEIIMYCEMGAQQKKVYDTYKKECRKKVEGIIAEKGKSRGAIEIFEALLKLRQIALFPALASPQFKNVESCKFDLFIDMLDEIVSEGHKVLVFSQFVKSLAFMEKHLKAKKCDYAYIDGSTKNRDAEIKKFQNTDTVNVFLLSLKAGGVGINLTAADYVILFDPWWNPAVESQAIDRAHRIGQVRKVTAYKLIVKDTVEEKILKLQDKKRALVNDLIAEEASFFKSLSGADIVDLFE